MRAICSRIAACAPMHPRLPPVARYTHAPPTYTPHAPELASHALHLRPLYWSQSHAPDQFAAAIAFAFFAKALRSLLLSLYCCTNGGSVR
jgi:hypothetical protein